MKPNALNRAFLCYLKQNLSNSILLEKFASVLYGLRGSMVALLPCMQEVPGLNPGQTQKSKSEIAQFLDIPMKPNALKRAFLCV